MIDVDVLGIGAWSTTYRGWPALVAACRGLASAAAHVPTTRPSPALLPPAERRRAPDGVAVALEVAREAVAMAGSTIDPTTLATVFASAHGDLAIVDDLCTMLANDPTALSPTRFHLSVHNAAAGFWSIATNDQAPSTALAGGDDSFALGLLEAATMAVAERRPVLLVAFDTPAAGLLATAVHNTALFGFAMIVAPASAAGSMRLSLAIEARPTSMPKPRLDALHALAASSPAARALVLAEALAIGQDVVVDHPLGPGTRLSVVVRHRRDAGGRRPDEPIE